MRTDWNLSVSPTCSIQQERKLIQKPSPPGNFYFHLQRQPEYPFFINTSTRAHHDSSFNPPSCFQPLLPPPIPLASLSTNSPPSVDPTIFLFPFLRGSLSTAVSIAAALAAAVATRKPLDPTQSPDRFRWRNASTAPAVSADLTAWSLRSRSISPPVLLVRDRARRECRSEWAWCRLGGGDTES